MDRNRVHKCLALFAPFLFLAFFALAEIGCKDREAQPPRVKQKIVRTKTVTVPAQGASVQPEKVPDTKKPDLLPLEVPEPLESIPGLRPKTTRDPFRSFIEIKTHVAPTKKTRKLLTPLQRYSLDQLKVVGIVEGTNIRKALLEDDVGKGYVVGRGEAVGSQGGKIAAIKSDRIIIEETYQDALGKKKVRRITKRLFSADKGGMP